MLAAGAGLSVTEVRGVGGLRLVAAHLCSRSRIFVSDPSRYPLSYLTLMNLPDATGWVLVHGVTSVVIPASRPRSDSGRGWSASGSILPDGDR